ncbi:DDE-type integrase/transposase/recombinase [Geobacter hydrogenophilus]|uniref:Transposase n=1 Tax=Geobacter hydrogenophilus TaxID=40983 RepID=A0A9W6LC49_9BACT|nr:Mu transposase C-terminal domain-containing protein [Geobacter hydrogenophilus]MBT0893758.1 DDE-type integrase/transposase/recombinase [Geobacter hydrogenophilus]GLI37545.1 transposase [Geobacter hydrogenophilus]
MAQRISLKAGSIVFCGNVEYEVIGPVDFSSVKVRNVIDGAIRVLTLGELSARSADEEKVPAAPLNCLSEKDQKISLQRFEIIKPAVRNKLSRKKIEELAAQNGVHFTTIYRMLREYRKSATPSSLMPKTHCRGGKGQHRIAQAVEDIIRQHFKAVVEAKLVDITKVSIQSLQTDIKNKCKIAGLKVPTWVTVADRLETYLKEQNIPRQKGRRKRRQRPTAGGTFPDAKWPLDVVQIDHTPLDLILVDDKDREPIGKPYLSLAIDVFSRMVLGFSLSFDAPSIFSVGQLIAHCILPKDHFLESVGVNAKWETFGIMRTLLLDNAGEFRSEDFVPFEEEYWVEISWRPVATPEYGGHIERYAKTLNNKIHNEPGSTFSNINDRGDYPSEEKAVYTIDEIEKWLTILIAKEYNEEEHSELGMSPRKKYELGIFGDDKTVGIGLPDIVEDQERLKIFLLPTFWRTIQREGIKLDKIKYFHDILRHWVGKTDGNGNARKFLFKRDPRKISPLYFYDPDRKEFFKLPYKDLTRPPMTIWELQGSKKRCKEKGIDDPDEQQIFEAYAERMKIRDEAVAKTKQARREREVERRRVKSKPIDQTDRGNAFAKTEEQSAPLDDIASIYDDASLLDGVIVKKTTGEE